MVLITHNPYEDLFWCGPLTGWSPDATKAVKYVHWGWAEQACRYIREGVRPIPGTMYQPTPREVPNPVASA